MGDERARWFKASITAAALATAALAQGAPPGPPASSAAPPRPPPAGVRLYVEPSLSEPWVVSLVNEGKTPVRLIADARLLWFEMIEAPEPPPKGKKPSAPRAYPRGKLPICQVPSAMRPEEEMAARALILKPGERYEEAIDPILLCGAGRLMAGLKQGAVIYPHYGWIPPKKKKNDDSLPPLPHVVDSIAEPRDTLPARSIDGDPLVLLPDPPPAPAEPAASASASASPSPSPSSSASPSPSSSASPSPSSSASASASAGPVVPDLVDGRAARLEVTGPRWLDAHAGTDLSMTVTVTNVGHRAALMRMRSDDVTVWVKGPSGKEVACSRSRSNRGTVKDFFESFKPGARRSFTLRLHELCPVATFLRPGVYELLPEIVLQDSGEAHGLPALVTAKVAERATRARVITGKHDYLTAPLEAKKP